MSDVIVMLCCVTGGWGLELEEDIVCREDFEVEGGWDESGEDWGCW